jgi:hypothetical protein
VGRRVEWEWEVVVEVVENVEEVEGVENVGDVGDVEDVESVEDVVGDVGEAVEDVGVVSSVVRSKGLLGWSGGCCCCRREFEFVVGSVGVVEFVVVGVARGLVVVRSVFGALLLVLGSNSRVLF